MIRAVFILAFLLTACGREGGPKVIYGCPLAIFPDGTVQCVGDGQ